VAAPSSVLQRFSLCLIESNGNENFKVIPNPGFLPDHPQNWTTGSWCNFRHTLTISERSVHNVLSYLANTQTDRQTNKQTKSGKNITSLAEAIIHSTTCLTVLFYLLTQLVLLTVLQDYLSNDILDFYETTPYVPVTIRPTVPITCPPCEVKLAITNLRGLAVSDCQWVFNTSDRPPMPNRTVYVRAVPTLGSNARTTLLEFLPASTKSKTGTGWDNYPVPAILVSFQGFNLLIVFFVLLEFENCFLILLV